MEKRIGLGVQKRKKPTKRNKKTLVKKVVDYLKSDSYMFAPLISRSSDFLASRIGLAPSTVTGVELKENVKGENRSLVEKVGDYLKSEIYFYAPLLHPQLVISSKGVDEKMKGVRIKVRTQKLTRKTNESGVVEESNVTVEKEMSPGQEKLAHKETVKHMVYQSCRTFSVPGKRMLDSQLRKYLIE